MKWLFLKLLFVALVVYYVPRFCDSKTDGFTLTNIHSDLPYSSQWEISCKELPNIFHQRFTYLGSGGQAYAFLSEDGNYVLKFFKHHLRRLPFWLKVLPLPSRFAIKKEIKREKRQQKLLRDFESYKIAYQILPEESGLLYAHLNKTKDLKKQARIVDKLGIEHKVDLDGVEFVVQKRASLVFPHLDTLIEQGKIEKAKRSIDALFFLVTSRCQKGIYDEDPRIRHNMGFVEDKAILIDVGRLRKDPQRKDPEVQKKDLLKITAHLQVYLKEHSPDLYEYLKKKLYE